MADLQTQALQAKITKDQQTGKAAMLTGLAALAKVALGNKQLEVDAVDMLLGHQSNAIDMGSRHGHAQNQTQLAALEHGHRHGLAIAEHRRSLANDRRQAATSDREFAHRQATEAAQQQQGGEGGGDQQQEQQPTMSRDEMRGALQQQLMGMLQRGELQFTRDEDGRIAGVRPANPMVPPGARPQYPQPAAH